MLQAHDWPGNVRELRNNIERLMILAGGDPDTVITADMLPEEIGSNVPLPVNGGAEHLMSLPLREAREIFEREYLLAQINRFGGNISRTAEFVGMERSALHRKLRALGVSSEHRSEIAGLTLQFGAATVERLKAEGTVTRIVYVNGRYLPYAEAAVHVEDRGFQFADAVYEVCEVRDGRLVDETRHLAAARALACASSRIASADARRGAGARHARDHPAQPRAAWPRLSAGDARARPARVHLSAPTT